MTLSQAIDEVMPDTTIHHPFNPDPINPDQCALCGSTNAIAHMWKRGNIIGNGEVSL